MRARSLVVVTALLVGWVAQAQTPEELIGQLKDPDATVRRRAAEALGKKRAEAAIPTLGTLLTDKDASTRDAAAAALVRMGPKSVPVLLDDRFVNPSPVAGQTYRGVA